MILTIAVAVYIFVLGIFAERVIFAERRQPEGRGSDLWFPILVVLLWPIFGVIYWVITFSRWAVRP